MTNKPLQAESDDLLEPQREGPAVGVFSLVSPHVKLPDMEERILTQWKERNTFKRSVDNREGGPRFTIFEGPPTANGSPGIHHVLSRVFKDIFPRYKTMKGFYSPRKGGWDTHGLPVELEVEKQLGFSGKAQIEDYGVAKFNELCRQSVFKYVKEWERMTDRTAYWSDLEEAYVTYHNDYIETGWWILKTLWDAGLVYQGRRVTPHCPRCGTTLSSHEVALGYKENTPDPSVYVKFEADQATLPESVRSVVPVGASVYLLAWTTTPWTLPSNTGLAISAKDEYVLVRINATGDLLLLARALLHAAIPDKPTDANAEAITVLTRVFGSALEIVRYRPLYNPYEFDAEVQRFSHPGSRVLEQVAERPATLTYPVIATDYVSMEDGTGIVHTAPAFGEDDYNAGSNKGLFFVQPIDLAGKFTGSYPWHGKFAKNADNAICEDLRARGLLLRRETIKHTYPFCWRCDSPLLYYAKSSWYLKTSTLKERLLSANEAINWYPSHIKNGRFGEWLRGNVDWAISRERYWGTPIPFWECAECKHQEAVGSRGDLSAKPGVRDFTPDVDLHRPNVDDITYSCPKCGGTMRRIPEVMDCWFDSGMMPFAQWHYPFENKELVDAGAWYPADFICEAVDQTRGWFYSLHAIAALLEEATHGHIKAPSYDNVVCLGLILDGKGEKMSKSKGNVVNPFNVMSAHGADATRWYLLSAAPAGNNRRFSVDLVGDAVRKFLLTLWNTYSFFVTYANIDGWDPRAQAPVEPEPELDRWVLSRLNTLIGEVTDCLENYDATTASRKLQDFVDDLSNWYVRRSRRRFWKSENDGDKASAYQTLYTCLTTVSRLIAPFTPFVAEEIYQNLVCKVDPNAPDSVHLTDYPVADQSGIDLAAQSATDLVIKVVSLGRAARSKSKIRVRQPLQKLVVATSAPAEREALSRLANHVREELNVKEVLFVDMDSGLVDFQVKGKLNLLGPRFGQQMGRVVEAINAADPRSIAPKVRSGQSVEMGGFTIEASEIHVIAVDKPGYASATDGLTVAITTEITPELAAEGKARELVRFIQNMRKTAGFQISDRIVVNFSGSPEIERVCQTHAAYIQLETLAERLVKGTTAASTHTDEADIEGENVKLGVAKVG